MRIIPTFALALALVSVVSHAASANEPKAWYNDKGALTAPGKGDSASADGGRTLRMRELQPLIPEREGNFDDFVANVGAAGTNLHSILNVLDSADKYNANDVAIAKQKLPESMKTADAYIRRAREMLSSTSLPRGRQGAKERLLRIVHVKAGSEGADERLRASAQANALTCQFSLLNLKTAADPDQKKIDKYAAWLADAEKTLAAR